MGPHKLANPICSRQLTDVCDCCRCNESCLLTSQSSCAVTEQEVQLMQLMVGASLLFTFIYGRCQATNLIFYLLVFITYYYESKAKWQTHFILF